MSISDGVQTEGAELPSYDTIRRAHRNVRPTPDAQRIFWSVDGPLATSIWIMENDRNVDSREPYSRQTADGGTSWHPVSQSPLTEPKVSSMTVSVNDLDYWEDDWFDMHRDHSDPDGGDENDDGVLYGELPDWNPDEDEDGPVHLLMCCGTKRPRKKRLRLVVKPTVSGNEFLTVHDFLSAVHPWLMRLREDILAAMGLWDDKPLPSETKLMVNYNALNCLHMCEKEILICDRRKRPI